MKETNLATASRDGGGLTAEVAVAVREGLSRPSGQRSLPPWLLYDDAGSRLFEEITRLEEYYPTRVERGIIERHAGEIVELAAAGASAPLRIVELGSGGAEKTIALLRAVVARQRRALYMPIDVSAGALEAALQRLRAELPELDVRPVAARYSDALPQVSSVGPRRLVLWIGSSMGNFRDEDAVALLRGVRRSLLPGGCLLLGADRTKSAGVLIPAYDDARGVTAAFNKNLLVRINRELGGDFVLERFAHRAVWNEASSQVEMHLESLADQVVRIEALGLAVAFRAQERIHTEASVKYDDARVLNIIEASGFRLVKTFLDPKGWFGVHLARLEGTDAHPSEAPDTHL